MLTKEKIINSISELPEDFTFDDVIDKLIVLQKIEIGLRQVAEGKVISSEELKKRKASW